MTAFTDLETAALRAIFLETPVLQPILERQLDRSVVIERRNTGGGFVTALHVVGEVPALDSSPVLGYATHARIQGLQYGLGFVLFIADGKLAMLDAYSWGGENTADLDPTAVEFEIFHEPIKVVE